MVYTRYPWTVTLAGTVHFDGSNAFCQIFATVKPFRQRTKMREEAGAKVCWLIREGLDSEKALKALFGLPAVRFRVVDRDDPGQLLMPWEHSGDRRLARRARVQVFGTVAYRPLPDKRPDWFNTHTMDGLEFLDEILSSRRRWYRPGVLGQKRGLWALKTDVAEYFAARNRNREIAR